MKVYLRLIGQSVALGSILAKTWEPKTLKEFLLNLPFATSIFAILLLVALHARE